MKKKIYFIEEQKFDPKNSYTQHFKNGIGFQAKYRFEDDAIDSNGQKIGVPSANIEGCATTIEHDKIQTPLEVLNTYNYNPPTFTLQLKGLGFDEKSN